jgi:alpha,alpha-trehalase
MIWSLIFKRYEPEREGLREALCTLGNGVFATRGAAADCPNDETHYPGTYLAGGYNRAVSEVSGRPIENEDLVNLPNWLPLQFRIEDGDWIHFDRCDILGYRQELHLREGLLEREIAVRDDAGRITTWHERRIVSLADPRCAAIALRLVPENWSGRLTVRSALDGGVINDNVKRYRALESRHLETIGTAAPSPDVIVLHCRTRQSRLEVAEAARTRLVLPDGRTESSRETIEEPDLIEQRLTVEVQQGEAVNVEKVVGLVSSREPAITEPALEAQHTAERAEPFAALFERHRTAWHQLWADFDIDLATPNEALTVLKLRLHVFHLLQTVSEHSVDRDVGVPARGWHGEAYRGHIFWDELFIFPFFNLRMPVLTRALLRYRSRRLPEARRLAMLDGLHGAMYPWQSGSNGREESQLVHLNPRSGRWVPDNTHRQRHISSAIAYNVWQYFQVTDDHEFLEAYGAEMMLEIARFWASLAQWNEEFGRYEILGVMGPDEYHTAYPGVDAEKEGGLDNNAYTNVLAAWVMTRALDVLDLLSHNRRRAVCERLEVSEEEIARWDEISRKLRICFHGDGIISQFERYDELEEFDWEGYREKYGDIQRLDRILEAEGDDINRYKASKQADVLMLFYLFSADELSLLFERLGYPFRPEMIQRNIEYYLLRTSHGSTLSGVVHAWVLARSDRPRSWALFQEALDSDFSDVQGGTTPEGIHLGAMAGTVDLIQRGYLGLEIRGDILHLDPTLPDELDHLSIRIRFRRHQLSIRANQERMSVASDPVAACPIRIAYRGHLRWLSPGGTCQFKLVRTEEREGYTS